MSNAITRDIVNTLAERSSGKISLTVLWTQEIPPPTEAHAIRRFKAPAPRNLPLRAKPADFICIVRCNRVCHSLVVLSRGRDFTTEETTGPEILPGIIKSRPPAASLDFNYPVEQRNSRYPLCSPFDRIIASNCEVIRSLNLCCTVGIDAIMILLH